MSYIGKPPVSGDFVVLEDITTSPSASYTLQRNSANFVPESANHMLVSLNGTIQKPNSSFTVSGSTITFSSALTSSDAIDFILVLGNVNAVSVATTVADDAITDAKTNFVSTSSAAGLQIKGDGTTDGTLQLNCSQNSHGIKLKSPSHSSSQSYTLTFPTTAPSANTFLKTDGSGNLSFASAGGLALVDSGNGTNATNLSIQSKFTSDYTNYKLVATLTPAVDGNDLKGRLMIGSSASSDSEYRYRVRSWRRNSSSNDEANQTGWGADHFRLNTSGISNNTQFGANVVLYIFNPLTQSSTNTPNDCHLMGETFVYADNGYIAKSVLGVNYQTSSNFDGIRLEFSSGNIALYNYSLFGISGS